MDEIEHNHNIVCRIKMCISQYLLEITFIAIVVSITIIGYEKINRPVISEKQWYLQDDNTESSIGWMKMWNQYQKIEGKQNVNVALIDTGVDEKNSEIANSIVINTELSGIRDSIGHGTQIAGIICADQYRGKVSGIADSKKIRLVPIKVIDTNMISSEDNYSCNEKTLINAIKKAEKNGCKICNISLNSDVSDDKLKQVIEDSNMLFVVSAGNGNPYGKNIDKFKSYPASYKLPNMITVTGIKSNGRLSRKANYGKCVDVAAPGSEIYNINLDGSYGSSSGTSYSAAIVTGLAAMLIICNKSLTAEDCKHIIVKTSKEGRRYKNSAKIIPVISMYDALISATKERNENE